MGTKLTIVEGNSNDKDNARAFMVKGERGYSAYEVAVQNGYEGTEEEWKDSFLNAENYYNKNEVYNKTETDNKLKKKVFYFDNVNLMKNATNLQNGDYVITKGYYEANDGGDAEYLIREKTNEDIEDNGSIHFLNNNLVAELIKENNKINLLQFGVKNDSVTDSSIQLQNALNYNGYIEGCDGTVVITKPIFIKNTSNKINIDFKDVTFLVNSNETIDFAFKILSNSNIRVRGKIKNLNINSNGKALIGLYVQDTLQFKLENIDIKASINQEYRIDREGETGNAVVIANNMRFTNGYEIGLENCKNSNAMDVSSPDSHYTDIITLGYQNHIVNNSMNFYTRIHSWNYKEDTINDSCMFLNSAQLVADTCYADTIQTMFNCYNQGSVDAISPIYFLNPDFYLLTHNDPTPIIVSNNFINNYGRIRITGGRFGYLSGKENLKLINYTDRSSNFRLNLLRLVDCYISNYECSKYFLEYSNTDLSITVNTEIANTISSYLSKVTTIHGYSMLNIGMSVNGYNSAGNYATVATITDDDFVVQNTDSFYAFIRPNSSNLSYPILCKLTTNKEIQINIPTSIDLGSSGFNLRINTFNILNPTNPLVK